MNKLFELFEEYINWPVDYTHVCWEQDSCSVRWNTDNNLEDLFNGDGDTYNEEIADGGWVVSNYTIFTLRDGCGGEFQAIFDLDKEIKE